MFDFIGTVIDPGESWRDWHHLGVRVYNGSSEWTTLTLRFGKGDIWLELRLGPDEILTLHDEQSSGVLVIENTGTQRLQIECRKTRD